MGNGGSESLWLPGGGRTTAGLLAILAIAVAVYSGTLRNGFVWDDVSFIQQNPLVQEIGNIPSFFWQGDSAGTGGINPYYRPVTTSSFALDAALWGNDPAGFHATNLALHLLVCAALFAVLGRTSVHPASAALATVLFALHPAHSEPVAYISARGDLLCGLFLLCSFLFHLKGEETGLHRHRASSVLSFLLALLAKDVAIVYPALLALRQALFAPERRRLPVLVPFILTAVAYLGVRSWVLAMGTWDAVPLTIRIANAGVFIAEYVRFALFPSGLKVFYSVPLKTSLADPVVIAAWGGGVAVAGLLAACARRHPEIAFGIAWFFAGLLPVCGIVTLLYPACMADRYLYIPLIGAAMAAAALIDRIAGSRNTRWASAGIVASAVTAVIFSCITTMRIPAWHDSISLWKAADAGAPDTPYILTSLGWAYRMRGDYARAETALNRAIEVRDEDALPHLNLSGIAFAQGDIEEAETHVIRALQLEPRNVEAFYALAVIKVRQGFDPEAVWLLENVIRADPRNRTARNLLDQLLQRRDIALRR
jgi:tetratricopeptide (TPR) repeat protein